MYRQIWLAPHHRKFQCILWRNSSQEPVRTLQLNTVTYGLKSSSYLATKCLQRVAIANKEKSPGAATKILNDFYVDDFISGAETTDEAASIINQVRTILHKVGIPLRKIQSNVVDLFDQNFNESITLDFKDSTAKPLGIMWKPHPDCFQYKLSLTEQQRGVSKRELLSAISKLFDPLGMITPVTIHGKIIIQDVWKAKLSWDETLPMSIQDDWQTFSKRLAGIPSLEIPRYIFDDSGDHLELHGFCDASTRAYGACIYIRCVFGSHMKSNLLCSKSRVAPIRPVTLPRLELAAAVLLAELYSKLGNQIRAKCRNHHFWSDSTITLHWINSTPNHFGTVVANRIAVIQESTNVQSWHHCRSKDNPADLISRGCSLEESTSRRLWFNGPDFLHQLEFIPEPFVSEPKFQLPETKRNINILLINESDDLQSYFSKFSSFSKLQRIFAYVCRFITKIKSRHRTSNATFLTTDELTRATIDLVRLSQKESFPSELKLLRSNRVSLIKKSKIHNLNPFLDGEGIIRVGGRIRHADVTYNVKHPPLIAKTHPLSKLIAKHYHIVHLHCGANHLLSVIRQHFWIISGRSLCRKIVQSCLNCIRARPCIKPEIMGNLPQYRLTQFQPCFSNTGVDFAGPLLIRDRYTRNSKLIKAYISVFVCLSTRAMHLDLVTGLSAQAFLEVFKRFISRRGKPNTMFSDNATNFVAASRELHQAFSNAQCQSQIFDYLSGKGITWKFIPLGAPHFGGLWEAGVKSVKTHLIRTLRDVKLNFDGFYTVLTQIESVLNSRPLSPLSNSPDDFAPLTPAHFLIGRSTEFVPESSLDGHSENRLNQYQNRQRLIHHFWKRWSREVLPELQRRTKWSTHFSNNLTVGALALLSEPNTPPFLWPLCRITSIHPGSDGVVRVVTVKTPTGASFKRPIAKLCVLP